MDDVSPSQRQLRKIPAVEIVLMAPELQPVAERLPRAVLRAAARNATEAVRQALLHALPPAVDVDADADTGVDTDTRALLQDVIARTLAELQWALRPEYRRAINASGVILHTGLGRAVLPPRALKHLVDNLAGYSLLQVDIETGRRGGRDNRIQWLLRQLTGAEAATVVNNNAAATALVLGTIGRGREVIVSRGQLVEIGGSYRLPDVMEASGARLVEVGTTNKTHPRDYVNAITERTSAIMRVHPSNYKITGFTSEVPLDTLVDIARTHNLVLYDDLGAGALLDVSQFGFRREPTLQDSVRAGADLISCSADKLIGGSQGGIILGRSDWVRAVRKNPIARMVRAGKLTLAVLEATLALFLDEGQAVHEVPTLRMLARSRSEIGQQAERIAAALQDQNVPAEVRVVKGYSQMGSGSLPGQNLPTRLVVVVPEQHSVSEVARRLRRHDPPIIARVKRSRLLLDPRTLLDGDEPALVAGLINVLGRRMVPPVTT